MKKNNKLSRKKKQATDNTIKPLRSKESKQKLRRWSFEADIALTLPAREEDGKLVPAQVLPTKTMRLEAIHYGNAKEAREQGESLKEGLLNTNDMFKQASIRVRPMPHETVNPVTMRQMIGFKDMSHLLDRALELVIKYAQDALLNGVEHSRLIEMPAIEADTEKGIQAVPAVTLVTMKEDFYRQAIKELSANTTTVDPSGVQDHKDEAQTVGGQ